LNDKIRPESHLANHRKPDSSPAISFDVRFSPDFVEEVGE
jgi:hypothetical protein